MPGGGRRLGETAANIGYRSAAFIGETFPYPACRALSDIAGRVAYRAAAGRREMVARHQQRVAGGTLDYRFNSLPSDASLAHPYWGSAIELAEVLELARAGQISAHAEHFPLERVTELGQTRGAEAVHEPLQPLDLGLLAVDRAPKRELPAGVLLAPRMPRPCEEARAAGPDRQA